MNYSPNRLEISITRCWLVAIAALMLTGQTTSALAQNYSPGGNRNRRPRLAQRKPVPLAPAGTYKDAVTAGQSVAAPTGDQKDKKRKSKVRGDAPCLCWVKAGVPTRAVMLCIHGLGLNSSSYEQWGEKLSQVGVATYAIDVRGFGSWMEAKGHQDVDFKACLQDVRSTLQWIRKANPGRPIFLLGESMGGAIALQATAAFPELIDGLISACSSGDRFKQKKMDLKVALHMLTPGGFRRDMNVGNSIVEQATNNPELKAEWEGDPLNRMKLSPKELIQFQKFMNENHEAAKLILASPVLMVQGSRDGLVKPEGTEELFAELATNDKELLMVPNAEHLIFEEGQFTDFVVDSVATWVRKHAPEATQPGILSQNQMMQGNGRKRQGRGGPLAGLGQGSGGFPPGGTFPGGQPGPGALAIKQAITNVMNGQPPGLPPLLPPGTPPVGAGMLTNPGPTDPTGQTPTAVAAIPTSTVPGSNSPSAQPAVPESSPGSAFAGIPGQFLAQAKQQIAEGKFHLAMRTLEAELQIDPNNAEAHFLLGKVYLNSKEFQKARAHFRHAIRAGRGGHHSAQANQEMMTLPRDIVAPQSPTGLPGGQRPGRRLRAGLNRGRGGPQAELGQPTVIVFNAKWCEPGKDMANIVAQAQQRFGDRVKFIQIDVDDPANEALVDKYSIGPVPTTIFLTPSGEVADYCVGYAGIDGMINGMTKIVQLSIR